MKFFTLLLVFNVYPFGSLQNAKDINTKKFEILLLRNILKDYDKRSRPVEDVNSPLKVTVSISLNQILQVDEKDQLITTNLWRYLCWKDDFLKWNPVNYGNITQISILRSNIWAPDIQLYNSASYDAQINTNTRIILRKDGEILDVLPMVVKSTCKIDVTWFPFDEQKCSLTFGSWSHSSREMLLELNENATVYGSWFTTNGEWKLESASAKKSFLSDSFIPNEPYVIITYTIRMKRRPFYYFFNLLVPCGLIGFLATLGFTLPPESGEKLSLGATILFSLIVFLNMITESMPANSDDVPLLGTYFNCVMFTIALSVVSTIVVNLNLKTAHPKELQGLSKKVFLCWLPRILGINTSPNILRQTERKKRRKAKVGDAADGLSACSTSYKTRRQQWLLIAGVVDRLCLICSIFFTLVSVAVFLVYAF